MQLSAKALLKPFNTPSKDNEDIGSVDEEPEDIEMAETYEDGESGVDENEDGDEAEDEGERDEDVDEEEDPLDVLDGEERRRLLEDTLVVRTTLSKVCVYISSSLSFYSHLLS